MPYILINDESLNEENIQFKNSVHDTSLSKVNEKNIFISFSFYTRKWFYLLYIDFIVILISNIKIKLHDKILGK